MLPRALPLRKTEAMKKICSKTELKSKLEELKNEGKKIVFTNGCFDILHAGHTHYLAKAKALGDVLVLGLNSDSSVRSIKGEKRPLIPEEERAAVIAALESVDYVTIFEESTPLELIEFLRPHILVKGGDWNEDDVVGRSAVQSWGGRVVIIEQLKVYPPPT